MLVTDSIDDAMFLSQPARPDVRSQVFEAFWLPNSGKGISHYSFDYLKSAHRQAMVRADPVTEIFPELRVEYCLARGVFGGNPLTSAHPTPVPPAAPPRFRAPIRPAGHARELLVIAQHCVVIGEGELFPPGSSVQRQQ